MVSFISSLFASRDTARREATRLITVYGRNAIGQAHLAYANAYAGPDPRAFEQAGRVLEEVMLKLDWTVRA